MRYSLEQILEATLCCCNVSEEEWRLKKHKRDGYLVRVKEIVSLIACQQGYSCNEIGCFLHQNRTTIIYHIKTLKEHIAIYPSIQGLIDAVFEKLGPLPEYQKQMTTYCWLARSSSGLLTISPDIPEKLGGFWIAEGSKPFPQDQFPQVTYEKGPVKVKIKVTIEENEKM